MNKSDVIIRLTEVFRKVLNNPSLILTYELTAKDVEGWDSLTHMLLITQVENDFSIKFKLKELNKMRNVGDMIELISSKL